MENLNKNIKIVFMGTPSFAVPILEGLVENYNVCLVVAQPDRKKDRRGNVIMPDAKNYALEHNIEVFQPEKIKDEYQKIIDLAPDMIVTAAYGQIIPLELINYPKYGCINVHGSLLPDLRGGAPIHWAIIRGYKETGVTVMRMNDKMDAGDIISQSKIKIDDDENLGSLYSRMSYLGKSLLLDSIPKIINNQANYIKQDNNMVSYGFNISKNDLKIDFSKSAIDVNNLVRGLSPNPVAYCILDNKRVKVYKTEAVLHEFKGEYGEIVEVDNTSFLVKCKTGAVRVVDIGIEGKKRCLVKDYFNGINKNDLLGKVLK